MLMSLPAAGSRQSRKLTELRLVSFADAIAQPLPFGSTVEHPVKRY